MFYKFIVILCVFTVKILSHCDKSLLPDLTYRLSGSNLEWPCQSTKNIYTTTGRYIAKHVIATRAQIYHDEFIVALPRYKSGVPFTLGRVKSKKGSCYSTVEPYPCWSMQEEGNCQAFQSVVDIFIDRQGILWVLDVGVVNTLMQPIRRCSPKVIAIDVKTNKVIKIIDLSKLICTESRLQYLAVDYDPHGRPFVYISDAGTRTILVHNCNENKSHRVVLPDAVTVGCKTKDVLYIVLIRKSCGTNILYLTYLGSSRIYSIKTEHLRKGMGSGAVIDVGATPKGKSIVLLGTDNGSSLFFRYKGHSCIYLWNTETCFKESNFLEVQKGGECRLATQVLPGHKRYMWTIESNFPDFIGNTVGCNGASVVIHPVVRECND